MTSSVHERDKRSVGDHASMTAENMIPTDAAAAAAATGTNRPMRIKRDLSDYLYNGRWINDGKTTQLSISLNRFSDKVIQLMKSNMRSVHI